MNRPSATEVRRAAWLRILAIGLLIAAIAALTPLALRYLGNWLMVEDNLQRAGAAVVFGGHLPFRAMEAAAIYRQGWVREIWLTRGGVSQEATALSQLGIEIVPEYALSKQVLQRLGVPSQAIRLLDGRTQDTAEEVRVVAEQLKVAGYDSVILITSKYHARRVRVTWRSLVGNFPEAIVRYTPDDPFQPDRWWRNTGDILAVTRELFGLTNAWAGYPVPSER